MGDLVRLADLSHAIDRLALARSHDEVDDRDIELTLEELAGGEREAVAIALSYALRRRDTEGQTPANVRAVAVLAATVRRMQPN